MQALESRSSARTEHVRAIKEWTREALGLAGAIIMVTELKCTEPGCPPLETIIAVLRGPSDAIKRKLHVGLSDVTREQVIEAFTREEVRHEDRT